MTWQQRITELYKTRAWPRGIAGRPEFYPSVEAAQLTDAEAALDASLPESLRSLLKESDGVMDMMAIDGGEWFESMWLLWSAREIVEQNCYYRAKRERCPGDRDFSRLVFFADAGTDGIRFAFPVEGRACAQRVVVWHPIRDTVDEIAPSLEAFLDGWLTGTITV